MRAIASLLAVLTLAGSIDYDPEGNWEGPVLCPQSMPGGGWAFFAKTFHVPRWNLPAGDEVPFLVSSLSYTNAIQPVMFGWGWYEPFPNTTDHEGVTWTWESNSGTGGVLYTCRERHFLWGAIIWRTATWAGQIWGYAFPSEFPPPGSGTRPTGGGEGEQVCYEYFEYWYDEFGYYHEEVLATWCEDLPET